ncbi:MAG: M20/M25/M40 family metallo-hydrolase [Planctomycetota bacterium]
MLSSRIRVPVLFPLLLGTVSLLPQQAASGQAASGQTALGQQGTTAVASATRGSDVVARTRRVDPISVEQADAIHDQGIRKSQVHRFLRDMTGQIGHRLTGSPNFTKACAWAKGEFEKMGLEVELEKWDEWPTVWSRGEWVGRIEQPIELDMYVATEAWTAGTKGPTTGHFALAPSGDDEASDCKGRWVISSRRPSRRVRAAVQEQGALGVVYRARDPNAKYPTRVRVFGDSKVARAPLADAPTMPEIAVRSDDFDTLLALVEDGKDPVATFDIQNRFEEGPIVLNNVVATLRGSEKPDEVIIVSSHLDSWHQAQGCTDNGTGSATTLEAARILTAVGAKPKRTIKFCLWGGEEQGLLGSRGYVQRHRTDMNKVSAVFNHDTGTNWAQSLAVTEKMHAQLEPVFAHVIRMMTPPDKDFDGSVFNLRVVPRVTGGGGSDHASFIAALVPGLNWGLKGRADYFQHTWHTQWDVFENAIEEYQRHTATVVALAALGTANLDEMLDREGVQPRGSRRNNQSTAFASAWFGAEMKQFRFDSVKEDGRAKKLGVQKGDVLIAIEGKKLESMRQVFQFAREAKGEMVRFTFQRGDKTFDASMKKDDMNRRSRRGGRRTERNGDGKAKEKPAAKKPAEKSGEKVGGGGR